MTPRALLPVLFAALAVAMAGPARGATEPVNRTPYISTYYIEPEVSTGVHAVIRYYVTDYFQKEYMQDDASARFTIDYWVNGVKQTLSDVGPGDQTLDLGILPQGKILFALQATDALGVKSHRLFQEFRVIDPADKIIPGSQVLYPDLAAFGISSNDTDPVATTAGLTAMLKWASTNGYRKVVLPRGRYRIDENATVQMATGLTLDMNGSTFKLNPNALAKCLVLEFVDCVDSHVVNGTFEGELNEHDFTNAPSNSEWVNCMSIAQGSEYCSVEDVTIVDFTGYGTCSNHRHTYNTPKPIGANFIPGDVDGSGNDAPSTVRTTCRNSIDVQAFVNAYGFIQMGIYLGYQGNPAGHWVYRAHFYDSGTNYLESIEGYMYRRLYPPANAKWARFTLYTTNQPSTLEVYNFRAPYNCAYKNIQHRNIRCVGMALCGFDNMLVEGCLFENCGWASATCAFDAEDGWDLMHDLTFRNNVFGTNPRNEFLTCAGHNFVMENNVMKTYIWDRTRGYVIRNNTLKSGTYLFGRGDRTGYVRITNNVYQGAAKVQMQSTAPDRTYCVKQESIANGVSGPSDGSVFYYQCAITGGPVNARAVGCDIRNMTNAGGVFDIVDSTLSNCIMKTSGYKLRSRLKGSTIFNTYWYTSGGTISLENNVIHESYGVTSSGWSDGNEFLLTSNTVHTSLPYLIYVGNSYKQMVLHGNTIYSTHTNFYAVQLYNPIQTNLFNQLVEFQDNVFHANGGYLVRANYLPNPACRLRLHFFSNVLENIGLYTANLSNQPNVKISMTPTLPPAVALTAPTNGAVYAWGTPISLAATASDGDGRVVWVSFSEGTNTLGTDTNAPYACVWSNAPAGSYTLTASAMDDEWEVTDSDVIAITVLPPPNDSPAVTLTSPTNGAFFFESTPVTLTADASDPDGTVAQVDFYQGTNFLGSDTNAPFTCAWFCTPTGTLSLLASAEDDAGAVTTSETVSVTVLPRPPGTTNSWTNAAGGGFEVAGNWSNGVMPGPLDAALFNVAAAYTVTWSNSLTNRSVSLAKGTVRWELQGNAYCFTPSNAFNLISGAPVDLTIANGRFSSTDATKEHYLYLVGSGTLGGSTVRVVNAVATSARLFLGNAAGDAVTLLVDGPNSKWIEPFSGYCSWGGGAGSRINVIVTNDACIRLGGNVNVGCAGGALTVVRVTGAGSSFTNAGMMLPYQVYTPPATATVVVAEGGLVYGMGATTLRSNGTIRLANGGRFFNSTTNLALDILRGGVVEGTGSIRAKVRNLGGVIRPGGTNAIGLLSITGDVANADAQSLSNGTIQIELAGVGDYDRLSMANTFRASGTLVVRLINGFVPPVGARFRILEFRTAAGEFAEVDLPAGWSRWEASGLTVTGELVWRGAGALILLR